MGDEPWERAADRCSFQLTYARAGDRREIYPGGMSGPSIDDAFRPGESTPGEWCGELLDPDDRSEAGWIDRYASYAINEAVHEALEWFQVDGRPWLNPHGEQEDVIYALTAEFAAKLAALRTGGQP